MWRQASEITCPFSESGIAPDARVQRGSGSWLVPASAAAFGPPPSKRIAADRSQHAASYALQSLVERADTSLTAQHATRSRDYKARSDRCDVDVRLPCRPSRRWVTCATGCDSSERHWRAASSPLSSPRRSCPRSATGRPESRSPCSCSTAPIPPRSRRLVVTVQRPAVDRHRPGARDARRPAAATDG